MSEDRRELILMRWHALLGGLSGVAYCVRNRGAMPDEKRPALMLLDGDEKSHSALLSIRSRDPNTKNLVTMIPELYIKLEDRKPNNTLTGTDLNALRLTIWAATRSDETLRGLCNVEGGGAIEYLGLWSDLKRGQPMDGEMGMQIAFTYVFDPS